MADTPHRILNIAHRGASAYAPENSIAAFDEAVARKADMIEFDLRKTSDGKIILFHDSHISDGNGSRTPVSKATYSQVSDHQEPGLEKPVCFDQVLSEFGNRIAMNIEIKAAGFEKEVISALNANVPRFEPVISSFKPEILRHVKQLDKSMKVGLIIGESISGAVRLLTKPMIEKLFSLDDYDNFHLHHNLVSEELVEGLQDAGFSVYVWTVNETEEIEKLVDMGVHGIISDYPDIVYKIRKSKSAGMLKAMNGVPRELA